MHYFDWKINYHFCYLFHIHFMCEIKIDFISTILPVNPDFNWKISLLFFKTRVTLILHFIFKTFNFYFTIKFILHIRCKIYFTRHLWNRGWSIDMRLMLKIFDWKEDLLMMSFWNIELKVIKLFWKLKKKLPLSIALFLNQSDNRKQWPPPLPFKKFHS